MSVQETVGALVAAREEVEGAIGQVNECLDKLPGVLESIERAKGMVLQAQGNAHSNTLTEYLALLEQAEESTKTSHASLTLVPGELANAKEQGETYIAVATG